MSEAPPQAFTRRATLTALSFLLLFAGLLHAQEMQIIELRSRLADDVIAVVSPLLEPGGTITGSNNVLFVRASPTNVEQIRQAVAAIDRPPRQLLITVGQGTMSSDSSAEVRGSVSVGTGDVRVGVNQRPGTGSGAQVEGAATTQESNLANTSSVRALEGYEAYIAIGQSTPVTTTTVTPGWRGSDVYRTTEYRETATGFYATARLSGDRATLEISPRQQTPGKRGRVEIRSADTVLSGRLGEWMPIGAVNEQQSGSTGGMLVWGQRSSASQYTASVKVEEVH